MVPSALAPAWWVTRWLARFVTMLAMTAFTALTLSVGTGSIATADAPPPAAQRPVTVTLAVEPDPADAGSAQTTAGRTGVANPAQPDAAGAAPAASTDSAEPHPHADRVPATDEPAGAVGQRAPPRR